MTRSATVPWATGCRRPRRRTRTRTGSRGAPRARGGRLPQTLAAHPPRDGLLRIAAGLVLTAPFTPMLFMGEEWGADTPWQYFTNHEEAWLATAVRDGRRSEFA